MNYNLQWQIINDKCHIYKKKYKKRTITENVIQKSGHKWTIIKMPTL